ncbi:protein obstructor-E [Musca domestica]|uniref:Protein obstructor-E n=1 Tax=Musca domestica TaxID=7370 RepID=A0A9J7I718_MUSDO|nr:protein obstructor-E [Musca domestica]
MRLSQDLRLMNLVVVLLEISINPVQSLRHKVSRQNSNPCANHAVGDLVENPTDCSLFFFCGDDGETVEASCPYNMFFNPQTKLCDVVEKVPHCQTGNRPPSPANGPNSAAPAAPSAPVSAEDILANANRYCFDLYGQQAQSNALVFIANPQNCYQYFMCYHGQALVQECSANLYWNAKIGKCDMPTNVQCIPPELSNANAMQISPVPGGGEQPQEQETMCPVYGHHIFPHMERCDFFIYCVKGHAIVQRCPFFHYFDVESGRCKVRPMALCIKDLNLKFRMNSF